MNGPILVVEDDATLAQVLRKTLESEGYTVTLARDGRAALELGRQPDLQMIILDLMLPRMGGLEVCQRLRAENITTPIIMLTARGLDSDKVFGLRLGADDYLTKPFNIDELLARIEAIRRRSGQPEHAPRQLKVGDIEIDFQRMSVVKQERNLELSSREFQVLECLVKYAGQTVEREKIYQEVWGYDTAVTNRTIDFHIARLRQKLEDNPREPKYILTVHRSGYRFVV
ncbi:response regulator transcription factor [Candidatus Cyanaurora vandensis]|uniref:response regulator transcription factor n=1 Tax=Candidatus Cyanaurora vandensis TaxID=2714958 RepID=UPI00257D7FB3|nr:response regulator transcription factor [Candidatus Cyanaurora vandensis]